jgi:hypothetical protein
VFFHFAVIFNITQVSKLNYYSHENKYRLNCLNLFTYFSRIFGINFFSKVFLHQAVNDVSKACSSILLVDLSMNRFRFKGTVAPD